MRNPNLPDPEDENEPLFKRPDGVPEDWVRKVSRDKKGVKYVDPKDAGNDIRIQRGNPNSDYANSREPYVRWKKKRSIFR